MLEASLDLPSGISRNSAQVWLHVEIPLYRAKFDLAKRLLAERFGFP
jgi:hypothetical protein